MTRDFAICGCGFFGTLGFDVQWKINDTNRAANSGFSAKDRSRWTPPWRNVLVEKDIVKLSNLRRNEEQRDEMTGEFIFFWKMPSRVIMMRHQIDFVESG